MRFPARLKNVNLANHHSAPTYLVKMLIAHKNPLWTAGEIEAELARIEGTMPGLLVDAADHVGGAGLEEGAAGFHQILARKAANGGQGLRPVKWLPDNPAAVPGRPPYEEAEIVNGLRGAYDKWGHPEVGAATAKWLETQGLLP